MISEALSCTLCSENFNHELNEDHTPIVGSCGHTFCRKCIVEQNLNGKCQDCGMKNAFCSDRLNPNYGMCTLLRSLGQNAMSRASHESTGNDDSVRGSFYPIPLSPRGQRAIKQEELTDEEVQDSMMMATLETSVACTPFKREGTAIEEGSSSPSTKRFKMEGEGEGEEEEEEDLLVGDASSCSTIGYGGNGKEPDTFFSLPMFGDSRYRTENEPHLNNQQPLPMWSAQRSRRHSNEKENNAEDLDDLSSLVRRARQVARMPSNEEIDGIIGEKEKDSDVPINNVDLDKQWLHAVKKPGVQLCRIRQFQVDSRTKDDKLGRKCSDWALKMGYIASESRAIPTRLLQFPSRAKAYLGQPIQTYKENAARDNEWFKDIQREDKKRKSSSTYVNTYRNFAGVHEKSNTSKKGGLKTGDVVAMLVKGGYKKGEAYFGIIEDDELLIRTPKAAENEGFPAPHIFSESNGLYFNGLMLRRIKWMRRGMVRELPYQIANGRQVGWLVESGPNWFCMPKHSKGNMSCFDIMSSQEFLNRTEPISKSRVS